QYCGADSLCLAAPFPSGSGQCGFAAAANQYAGLFHHPDTSPACRAGFYAYSCGLSAVPAAVHHAGCSLLFYAWTQPAGGWVCCGSVFLRCADYAVHGLRCSLGGSALPTECTSLDQLGAGYCSTDRYWCLCIWVSFPDQSHRACVSAAVRGSAFPQCLHV